MDDSWKNALKDEFSKPYFTDLMNFIDQQYKVKKDKIFPDQDQIFRALELCPFDDVKVVILGQDPYPTKGHAHGLCFSVEEYINPFPKSLNNIFKEIHSDLGKRNPDNGSLLRWAQQGVLLLNAVLTVEEGKPESHARKGWEQFTDAIIQHLNENKTGIVYLLWGAKAQQKAEFVNEQKNLVLKTVHPSPLSSHRGFFGSKHFSKTNIYLIESGKEPINW